MRRRASPTGPALVFVATFATLVGAGFVGMRHVPWLASARQEVPPDRFERPWYTVIGGDGRNLDHMILWNDIDGSIENARRADVVFVGSSKIQFALPSHALAAFQKESGLTAFSIAVPGGGLEFPLALIQKFDLRPRIVVAEMTIFEPPGDTPESRRVRDADWWASVTAVWEARLARVAMPVVSRVFPSFVTVRPPEMLLRSSANGAWWAAVWPHRHVPVNFTPTPMWWRTSLARRFQTALAARGTQLVLTCVPGLIVGCEAPAAQPLATALHVPAVFPHVQEIWAMDPAHLCPLSGKRYGRALLREVAELDAVRTVARERRATRLARHDPLEPSAEASR